MSFLEQKAAEPGFLFEAFFMFWVAEGSIQNVQNYHFEFPYFAKKECRFCQKSSQIACTKTALGAKGANIKVSNENV